jgi:2-hydroxy-3-keto-5-methylthiopentenyl-1-phosphate phosphatase
MWRVLCDFDGTIATEDVTDSILTRFAAPEWQAIEAEWRSGRIGSRDCMARQVALIRATPAELDEHLATVEIDPHFADFVGLCRAHGMPVTVVSDGLDYAINALLAREGLADVPVIANRLESTGPDSYRLDFPNSNSDCRSASGNCKCLIAALGEAPSQTLLIGDGVSDMCAAGVVDLVFAKHTLLDHCRKAGLAHVPCLNFADAESLMTALIDDSAVGVEPLRVARSIPVPKSLKG